MTVRMTTKRRRGCPTARTDAREAERAVRPAGQANGRDMVRSWPSGRAASWASPRSVDQDQRFEALVDEVADETEAAALRIVPARPSVGGLGWPPPRGEPA